MKALRTLCVLIGILGMTGLSFGQTSFTGTYSFGSVTTATGLTDPTAVPTATGVTFGSFSAVGQTTTNPNAGSRFSFTGQPTGATNGSDVFSGSISTSQYYQFSVTVATNYTVNLTGITFTIQRSSTGIRQYAVRGSADSYAANLSASESVTALSVVATNVFQITDATTSATTGSTIDLSGGSYANLAAGTTVTFRFYGWNAEATGGSFSIDDVVLSGNYTYTAPVTNFYSASSGDLDNVASWGTDTDGSGTLPVNFTTDNQVFNIRNNANPTIGANWTVSGTGSKIVLGDGAAATNFTIPASFTVTGPIDISANATLTMNNATIAHTYGSVSATSTINYAASATQALPSTPTTYGNLKLTNGTKTFAAGTYTIGGNLTVDGVTDFDGAGSPFTTINLAGNMTLANGTTFAAAVTNRFTLVCNGSTAQTLTGAGSDLKVFRITVNNANGVTLSSAGGSTNATLGNASGGGITMSNGTLNTSSNTVTMYQSAAANIITETATNRVIGTVSMTKTVGTAVTTSQFNSLGLSIAAGTDDLGDVTVTRVTGAAVVVNDKSGINRRYTVSSTNPPTAGRDVTISWLSSDDNSKTLTSGMLFKSTNSGSTWGLVASGDYSTRSVVLAGQTSFGMYTASDANSALPVELTSFTVSSNGRSVVLRWNTATETNNHGFDVEKLVAGNWSHVGFVAGQGSSNSAHSYSFTDAAANGATHYRLKQIDRDGAFTYSAAVEAVVTGAVNAYGLAQNFPNPFNPATRISYDLPVSGQVSLKVYDMLGKEVATLANGIRPAGTNVAEFDASHLPSGLYFYTLRAGSFTSTRKMLLVK